MTRTVRVLLVFALAVAVYPLYVRGLEKNPPGFNRDESSMAFNAISISRYGVDEYGHRYPLYFRAFGEYKNPVQVYLLALIFELFEPGNGVARLLGATEIYLAGMVFGLLAFAISRSVLVSIASAGMALGTPWLYQLGRMLFEMPLIPPLLWSFLLVLLFAARRERWGWGIVLPLALLAALMTYSYEAMKLLAPLYVLGLVFFWSAQRRRGILATWITYGVLLLPLFLYTIRNPAAGTARLRWSTPLFGPFGNELMPDMSLVLTKNYLSMLDLGVLLVHGDRILEHHVPGSGGMLLLGAFLLAGIGLVALYRWRGFDPWWTFVLYGLILSPLPGAIGGPRFSATRLVTLPLFVMPFAIAGLDWLLRRRRPLAFGVVAGLLALTAGQIGFFLAVYWRDPSNRAVAYHANYPSLLDAVLAQPRRPIFLVDRLPAATQYIHGLWYGELRKVPRGTLVRVRRGQELPPGAIFLDEPDCRGQIQFARANEFVACIQTE